MTHTQTGTPGAPGQQWPPGFSLSPADNRPGGKDPHTRHKTTSLRTRLLLSYLFPSLILVIIFGVGVHITVQRSLEDELSHRLTTVAQAVAGPLSAGRDADRLRRLRPDMDLVQANIRMKLEVFLDSTGVRRIFIFSPDLTSKVDTDPDVPFGREYHELRADLHEIRRVLNGESAASVLFTGSDGIRYKNGYAPVTSDGEVVAVVAVQGSADTFATLDRFAAWLVAWGLIMASLMAAISVLVARRITKPVGALVAAVRRMERGEMETSVAVAEGSRELVYLGAALNEMRLAVQLREEELRMMLSGIAHEVRNPLGGMELYLGLLQEELASRPHPTPDPTLYVDRIEKEMGYLKQVVDDFLGFARHAPPNRQVLVLTTLVDEVVALVNEDLRSRGIDLVATIPPEITVLGDPGPVRRALLNLIKNSIQAMPHGGPLMLRAFLVGAGEETSGAQGNHVASLSDTEDAQRSWRAMVSIVVEDSGHGMPQEVLNKAASPFYTTREKGTGLGLAIVHKIISQHGGTLNIQSAPEAGTTVTLTLPAGSDEAPE